MTTKMESIVDVDSLTDNHAVREVGISGDSVRVYTETWHNANANLLYELQSMEGVRIEKIEWDNEAIVLAEDF